MEEVILRRAEAKLKLTNTVIEGGQFSLKSKNTDLITDENVKVCIITCPSEVKIAVYSSFVFVLNRFSCNNSLTLSVNCDGLRKKNLFLCERFVIMHFAFPRVAKLQDILKFGVDKLFADDQHTLEDVDFESILGKSERGEWLTSPAEENRERGASGAVNAGRRHAGRISLFAVYTSVSHGYFCL